MPDDLNQIILIDKPAGLSSFGVVARARRILTERKRAAETARGVPKSQQTKRVKVGHTGTLDPFATGLLILLSGKFTRRAGEFSKLDKVYETEIRLGATSTTGDPEGEMTENTVTKIPTRAEVAETLREFIGPIQQTPPAFSAIKINGQRAYQIARRAENDTDKLSQIKIPPRNVTIYQIELLDYQWPRLKLRAHVSSGTYIRTLAADIGARLGVGGYCQTLRRTRVGEYDIKDAATLDEWMRTHELAKPDPAAD
jgi:tRNA pseudouridine55 synthase